VNYENNAEWDEIKALAPGMTVWLPWLYVLPGNETFYPSGLGTTLFGYINDGREHKGKPIHSPRVPYTSKQTKNSFQNLKVLHFQYAVRGRLDSKHRWYQCLEKIKFPQRNNIDIYRQYHHIDLSVTDISKIDPDWLASLKSIGVDIKDIKDDGKHWWDKEICSLFDEYGVGTFKKQAIWDTDWRVNYEHYFPGKKSEHIKDPRSKLDKWVHKWLAASQANRFSITNKIIDKLLRIIKW
jgi:hypothetical protein